MKVNIEAERVRKQMTKEETASRFGVSLKTYYNWVNETVDIPSSKLKKMADFFETEVEYLIESSEKKERERDGI